MGTGAFLRMFFLAVAVLAPSVGQPISRFGGEWILEPRDLGTYGSLVVEMSMESMLGATQHKPDAATYAERGKMYQDRTQEVLEKYAKEFKGSPGGKPLILHVEMTDLWSPYGAVGHMDLTVNLLDGTELVGQLEYKQSLGSWIRANDAKAAAKKIIKYIKEKKKPAPSNED